ncbi:MAG TPA: M14 family metallopeptidase [Gemmataceae bacterium]|jgi:hypothetical protein|nr:M14 family metallopeptidase [Gemmataceae bacterium]
MTLRTRPREALAWFALFLFAATVRLERQDAPARESRRAPPLLTIAERSGFTATARHTDVVAYCKRLAELSPLVRLGELGKSGEGRRLPLVILADPPVSTPEQAARSGKLVVLAVGSIHSGECDGKEALLMLAREMATAHQLPLLKDLVLVFAPLVNADGNERRGKHRPHQAGPPLVGTRCNAEGLDLNRDYVKLETPEVRALVRFFNRWDPAVFIDCHTRNGSYHCYAVTYEGPVCPAGDPRVISLVRDELLPEVSRRLEKRSGCKSFFYGNFSADRNCWKPGPALPRFGTNYLGLRNRISILSESYPYAPYRDRVLATRDFVREIFEYAAENQAKLRALLADAREAVQEAHPGEELVAVRHRMTALPGLRTVLGYGEQPDGSPPTATSSPRAYRLQYLGLAEPTLSVRRPRAYLLPPWAEVIENLQWHGIAVDELRQDVDLDVEVYRIDKVKKLGVDQQRQFIEVEATRRKERRRIPAGTVVVRTGQPLGTLASYLLEPQAEDGLCAWGFFEAGVQAGRDYPVLRLPSETPLMIGPVGLAPAAPSPGSLSASSHIP